MKPPPDAQLVTAAQAGETAAFVDLVGRYQGMVTGITLSILRDFQASEDAAQETFVIAWKKISEIHDGEKLRPWLAQIARNSALMALRKTRPLPALEAFPGASEVPRPDELIVEKEGIEIVMSALEGLPEKLRLPLILFYRDDQSVRKVSESLGLTPDIVKKRLSEGRALLRRRVLRLLDPVMRATGPGVVFTTAVACTIGAMMPPSAMATTALSATQKTATLTTVTTSKLSLTATVLTLGLCLPVGYGLHQTLKSPSPSGSSPKASLQASLISQRTRTTSETSPLVARWNQLKARHLANGSGGFPDLFQEINALEDPLQREAFTLLGIADWTKADPESALAYFSKGNPAQTYSWSHQNSVILEWLRNDPPAALTAVEEHNLWSTGCSGTILPYLAKGDPFHLTRAIMLLDQSNSSDWGRVPIAAAIVEAAHRDFAAAVNAINLNLSSHHREIALAAIARFLSESDPLKARSWIANLPPEDQTSALTTSYILGLATNDATGAFQELDKVKASLSSDQEANILRELAQNYVVEAFLWANQNSAPDRIEDSADPFALSARDRLNWEIFSQLQTQGTSFLEKLKSAGLLDQLSEADLPLHLRLIDISLNPEVFAENWQWLGEQPSSAGVELLRSKLITAAAWLNPQPAFELLEELKNLPSYQKHAEDLAQFLLAHHWLTQEERLRSSLSDVPQVVLEKIASAPGLDLTRLENTDFWQEQIQRLPAALKPGLAGKLAAAMAQRDPAESIRWTETLPDRESRQIALESTYHEWAQSYPEDAEQALEALNGSQNFDSAAAGYLGGLAKSDPDLAYSKLQELGPSWSNYETLADEILLPLARDEPALAAKWLGELNLSNEHKENLARQINEQASPSSTPFDQ